MAQAEDYLKIREEQGEPTEFAEGFGVKAILAGLFAAFVVLPGSMFMWLMLGQDLGQPAVWVTLIIFLEIAKRCRTKLTRQEMYIIWSVTFSVLGSAMGQGLNFIWMQYFVRSDAAAQFEITNQIPYWVAPAPDSQAYLTRNLLHRDWWVPLELMALLIIWWRLALLSLGYVMFRLTSDLEKLPFPLAPIAARGVTALAESEEETWRWRCFAVGSTIGIAFGLLYIGVPTLSGVFLRKPLYLLPVPFYDLTTKLQNVSWFRAVPLAISTDLGAVMVGFVLPFWMLVGSFTAGVLGRLVLNPFLYRADMLKMWQRLQVHCISGGRTRNCDGSPQFCALASPSGYVSYRDFRNCRPIERKYFPLCCRASAISLADRWRCQGDECCIRPTSGYPANRISLHGDNAEKG